MPRRTDFTEPAFKMKKDDRFHKIIISDHVLFELYPETETIITFIIIRRAIGIFSIVNILKTFQKGICVSRSVQDKKGITTQNIDAEIDRIQKDFTQGVQAQTNYQLHWDALDLSRTTDKKEQLERIRKWGKLKVC
ncbi:MAG: hypothetical protein PHI84_05025 [Kiritimatiellae bacterium]|nr:hypothetical protein [Kiritimatiellia bacterium]